MVPIREPRGRVWRDPWTGLWRVAVDGRGVILRDAETWDRAYSRAVAAVRTRRRAVELEAITAGLVTAARAGTLTAAELAEHWRHLFTTRPLPITKEDR